MDPRLPSEDPRVFAVNRLPPRASGWPCPDLASALTASYGAAPGLLRLEGDWRASWVADPADAPDGFEREDFNDAAWEALAVPGMLELQGHGTPIYSNATYPFAAAPPRVLAPAPAGWTAASEPNPTVSYRQRFTIPPAWIGRRIILHFGGVRSAMQIWVNGRWIGYSEDSNSPAEFDLTAAVRAGGNLLAVRVWKWCAGSWLEDQDMWRLLGIHRDVLLWSAAPVHVWDWQARPHWTPGARTAQVRCSAEVNGVAANHQVRFTVFDAGLAVATATVAVAVGVAEATLTVSDPRPWSHEDPALYRVTVELLDSDGALIEARGRDLGIRHVALGPDGFRLNGAAMKLIGVNRHEHDAESGPVLTADSMRADVLAIRRAHFNLIRTSHYPDDPRFYELCDRIGILVMDEANIESHGISYHKRVLPGDLPEWRANVLDRVARLVVRDRGHACVVSWSLGNEAGFGDAFPAMAEEVRRLDAERRPIQYADMNLAADMDSQTYPTVAWLRQHLAGTAVRKGEHGQTSHVHQHGPYPSGKPFFLNEYAHARGNALGNFADYWQLMRAEPSLIGGCIWNWQDLNLLKTVDGVRVSARGGDFGDRPNDGDFCECGLVDVHRRPHPHLHEVAYVQQPVAASAGAATGSIALVNRHAFLDLAACRCAWTLLDDGVPAASGTFTCSLPPGEQREVIVPGLADACAQARGERVLRLDVSLAHALPWIDAGAILASEAIALGGTWQPTALTPAAPVAADGLTFSDAGGRIVFAADGWPSAWEVAGRQLLTAPPSLNCWRAPTSGDRGWKMPQELSAWRGPAAFVSLRRVDHDDGPELIAVHRLPAAGTTCTVAWRIRSSAIIEVTTTLAPAPGAPDLPRFGLTWPIAGDLREVAWYGRGPHESYLDRHASAGLGIWRDHVDTWAHLMPRPQETGNRSDVRWTEFSGDGRRLRIEALEGPLALSAWPWTQEDLETTTEAWRMPRRPGITLNLDGAQMGLGCDNTWGERPYLQYRLPAAVGRSFAFRMIAG